jgi:hypothetical protein
VPDLSSPAESPTSQRSTATPTPKQIYLHVTPPTGNSEEAIKFSCIAIYRRRAGASRARGGKFFDIRQGNIVKRLGKFNADNRFEGVLRGNKQNSTFSRSKIDKGEALAIDLEPTNYPVQERNGRSLVAVCEFCARRCRFQIRSGDRRLGVDMVFCIKSLVLQPPMPHLPFEHRLGQIFADEVEGAPQAILLATL